MGHPTAPLMLLLLLLLRPTSPCPTVPPAAPADLDLTNRSRGCAELDWGPFEQQSRLWLSRNGIDALSPSSRVGPTLEELDLSHNGLRELPAAFLSRARGLRHLRLQHNRLRALPDGFFANASALQSLRLEGNPLPAVPPSAFQPALRLLALPCRCDAVGTVLAPCACAGPGCPECLCITSRDEPFNVTDFHGRECRGSVGLVAGVAGAVGSVAVLVVAVVVAAVWYRRRKAAAVAADGVWGKWESAAAHGQSRYISRTAEVGTGDAAAAAPDYENVFVSPHGAAATAQGWTPGWQEEQHSPQVPVDDDYFLESEASPGDQPIYANTQGPGEDNIYIIPDH